jgi:hypothetical protein
VNGDTLDASQLFDSNETGERALIISALKIKDSAGKDVTSNYQVSRKDASGKIVAIKPDPNPNPSPDPSPAPDPLPVPPPGVAPASGGNPPTDQPVGGDQGGIGGPSGFPVAGTDPAVVSGGLTSEPTGERPVLPAGSNGEQQHHFPPFAYIATQDEDERMKKSLRNKKIKNDYTFSIRNGGIQVPGEIVHAD